MSATHISAASAQNLARLFDLGNLIAVILPVLIPIWFGVSMFVYAMNRHHPNERVGHHTQWAAYRFYGMIGLIIPVATFFPISLKYYAVLWIVLMAILIPLTIRSLYRIKKETWHDSVFESDVETP